MKPILLAAAALLATSLSLPAFAGAPGSDRGFDDLKTYSAPLGHETGQTVSSKSTSAGAKSPEAKMFNKKFGSPHPNFESGRR
ncbi:MAG: hypothetical protein WAO69_10845 [Aestuariivita sp.]|uniref:hypothetical protein n=1 Tax=Aestuariivita sp. TaxID=1872407 RepID=UPI003BB16F5B